jgi:Txe/YoeB family toxin of Txe-Axe toxin-antitoxin module
MSQDLTHTHSELAAKLKEVLKDHQRDGLSMIGNVDKLVGSLVRAVHQWIEEEPANTRKSA